jgi:hypothetical protein
LVESALWHACGNVGKAAALLGTDSARLGYMLSRDATLNETRRKAADLMLDQAEAVLIDDLQDADKQSDTAKWMLTNGGRGRGWTKEAPAGIGISFGADGAVAGALAIRWEVEKP